MATKIIDLTAYGYEGKTLSLKEPTGADMVAVNDYVIKEKKKNGEANQMLASLYLLNRLVEDAPFDTRIESLKAVPFKLLRMLDKEIEEMINPLPTNEEETS